MGKLKDESPEQGYEVVTTVPRFLRCTVSDADRRASDDALHALIEAEKGVKRDQRRIKAAAKKVSDRLKALEEEQLVLHDRRALPEEDRMVRCEVRRSPTEQWIVRVDTGAEIARRPLTAEELAALHPTLPGTGPAPAPHVPEAVLDEETQRRIAADEEHAAKVKNLLTGFDIQAALDGRSDEPANDDESPEDEEPAPKGKKGGKGAKGKKKAETAEMFPGGEK